MPSELPGQVGSPALAVHAPAVGQNKHDWMHVSNTIPHDRADQLQKVQQGLIQGEQVYAVYDCTGAGTGFVGVTNLRVILQDNSFVGGKSAVTSLPIRSISAVSFVSDKSMFGKFFASATVAIASGSTVREATFRGDDKAKHIHDTILWLITQVAH